MSLESLRKLVKNKLEEFKQFLASCSYTNLKENPEDRINLLLLIIVAGILVLSLGIWIMGCCLPYVGSRMIIVGSGMLYVGVVLLAFWV